MESMRSKPRNQYQFALQHPFHPNALGVKCPTYSDRDTVPFKVHWAATVTFTQGQGGASGMNWIFLAPNGSVYGICSPSNTGDLSVSAFRNAMGPVSQKTTIGAALTSADRGINGVLCDSLLGYSGGFNTAPLIASTYANYRPVAGGIRITAQNNLNTNPSMIYVVSLPTTDNRFPYGLTTGNSTTGETSSAGTTYGEFLKAYIGWDPTSNANSLLQMPEVQRINSYELLDRELELKFRPCGPDAFKFRDTDVRGDHRLYNWNRTTNYDFVDSLGINTLGVTDAGIGSTYDCECTNTGGWNGYLIGINCLNSAPQLNIEYVVHCEGISSIGESSNTAYAGTTVPPPPSSQPLLSAEQILNGLQRFGSWFDLVDRGIQRMYSQSEMNRLTRMVNRLEF